MKFILGATLFCVFVRTLCKILNYKCPYEIQRIAEFKKENCMRIFGITSWSRFKCVTIQLPSLLMSYLHF